MSETVISCILSLVGTLVGTFGGILVNARLMNYRIEQLEKKQDKYNNVIARTYELEKKQAIIQEDIKVANHRINDLEKGV